MSGPHHPLLREFVKYLTHVSKLADITGYSDRALAMVKSGRTASPGILLVNDVLSVYRMKLAIVPEDFEYDNTTTHSLSHTTRSTRSSETKTTASTSEATGTVAVPVTSMGVAQREETGMKTNAEKLGELVLALAEDALFVRISKVPSMLDSDPMYSIQIAMARNNHPVSMTQAFTSLQLAEASDVNVIADAFIQRLKREAR